MGNSLKASYEKLVNDYIKSFEDLTGLSFDGKIAPDTFQFGDYYTSIADIMFVVDNGLGLDFFSKYVEHYIEESSNALTMREFHERGVHLLEDDEQVHVKAVIEVTLNSTISKNDFVKSRRVPRYVTDMIDSVLRELREFGTVQARTEVLL